MPKNLFVSYMRTVVPIAVGLVLGLAAKVGFQVDSATLTAVVTAAATGAYYTVFRLLEAWAGRLGSGWLATAAGALLGWARPPEYEKVADMPIRLTLDTSAMSQEIAEAFAEGMRRAGGPASGNASQ